MKWVLIGLTVFVLALSIATGYNIQRVGGLESGNRNIICESRKLRERYAPETALERAQLENARKNGQDCK